MLVIDSHVHFYDPTRPGGIPWPPIEDSLLHRPRLPCHYPAPATTTRVIAIESSPRASDHDWLLELAGRERLIAGVVANLPVGQPDFGAQLSAARRHPKLVGLRLRHDRLAAGIRHSNFLADLRRLAAAQLSLDVYGPPALWETLRQVAKSIPELTMIADHVANIRTEAHGCTTDWLTDLQAASSCKNIYCKVSGLVEGSRGLPGARTEEFHLPLLETVWRLFGEDRVLFGSNWPVCSRDAEVAEVMSLASAYAATRGSSVVEKFLSTNALSIYRSSPSVEAGDKWRCHPLPGSTMQSTST